MKERFEHIDSPFANETIGAQRVEEYGPRMATLLNESPFGQRLGGGYPPDAANLPQDEDEFEGTAIRCCGASADELEEEDFESLLAQQEVWADTAEQIAFRDRVLAAHIARSKAARGAAQQDLSPDEIKTVPGTSVKMLPEAAAAAGRLLAAANADLAKAQQAGDADALRTVGFSATSGYRGSDHQRRLWLQYFGAKDGYYDRTQVARDALPQGPHSEQAVAYMLKPEKRKGAGGFGLGGRIAAPGYSKHQNGIAIDWWQERRKGHGIRNKSDDASRARWRASWFHHWLKDHAASYGFKPIATEEWHWEYRAAAHGVQPVSTGASTLPTAPAQGPARASIADYLGGKLSTFTSTVLPLRVAVFCQKAALLSGDVDALVFAHGLLNGCSRPKRIPEGFITDAPFHLGRIVAASGRPMVLVVPLLDWSKPGGEAAFGAGHERWHALAEPRNLNAVIGEAMGEVARMRSGAPPSLQNLIIAGHSRAYDFLEPLASRRADPQMRQGALASLSQVWALDTTYGGRVESWLDWLNRDKRLQVTLFYRPASPTAAIGDAFYRRRGVRLKVIRANEGHCEVPGKRLSELLKPPAGADRETGYESLSDHEDPAVYEGLEDVEAFVQGEFASLSASDEENAWYPNASGEAENLVPQEALDADLSASRGLAFAAMEADELDESDETSEPSTTFEARGEDFDLEAYSDPGHDAPRVDIA